LLTLITGRANQNKPVLKKVKGETLKRLGPAIIVILLLVCVSPSGYAEEGTGNLPGAASITPEAAEKTKEDDRLPIHKQDEWQFFLSPYVWIPGVNINVSTLKGTMNTAIPWWEVASTIFSKSIGIMGRAEVWKGRWGFYLDGYYTYMGTSGSRVGATKEKTFGPVDFTIDKQIHLHGATINVAIPGQIGPGNITLTPSGSVKYISRIGSLDLGGRFLVGTWPRMAEKPLPALSLELLGGPRFNSINQYVRINLSVVKVANVPIDIGRFSLVAKHQTIKNSSYVIDYTNQYFEPFLGARISLWLTPKFIITLKGDVGGFGLIADDHVDCNFEGLVGYRVHKNIYVYAGYRARGTWYDLEENLAQINFSGWAHGPVLGMTYAF
jgi:hypothetical protein